jgi:hypothetical protein
MIQINDDVQKSRNNIDGRVAGQPRPSTNL